jgi:hypothetical protein
MKSSLINLGALVVCTAAASHAIASDAATPATVADRFVHALQHHRFNDAAAMFAPDAARDTTGIALTLKRIDDHLGGFATMHRVATLPTGKSVKLEVPAHIPIPKFEKFFQLRYSSTASDGQPVYYELNLSADTKAPQVLSFAVHLPASDAQSAKRADQLMRAIHR